MPEAVRLKIKHALTIFYVLQDVMTEQEPPNIVLLKLDEIRKEQALTNAKIGTLAEGMVSMRRQIDDLTKQVHEVNGRLDRIDQHIEGIRTDVHVVTLAVDEHTHRLDRIEKRLGLIDAGETH